jgi:AbrB family looped-hinge helix DNA binding protein
MSIPVATMITVSSKGQVVIPKEFRAAAGLEVGSKVVLECRENGILELHPLHSSIREIFGMGKKWLQKATKTTAEDVGIMATIVAEDEATKTKRSKS